jgi:hypothetical protein
MIRFAKFFAAAFAVLLLSAGTLRADQIDTFQNTPTNYRGDECCFQVALDQVNNDNISVTVTLLDGATSFAKTGYGQQPGFAFDLSGDPSITVTGYSATNWSFSSANVTTGNPSLGTFDDQFNLTSHGASVGVDSLSFNIYDASGISFSSFISNSYGNYFVADILGSNCYDGLSAIHTPGTVSVTPEPSSLMLFGTGLLGAGLLVRRRMYASAKA